MFNSYLFAHSIVLDGSGMFAAGVSYYSGIFTGSLSPSSQPTYNAYIATYFPTNLQTIYATLSYALCFPIIQSNLRTYAK